MERMEALKRAVGKADVCELLACAFAFPSERLAEGLASGALADDARECLMDAGVDREAAQDMAEGLRAWQESDAYELYTRMRITYSRLYLAPGDRTPILPYESAFLHVEKSAPGIPALFRSPVTLDVERQMHDAGVAAKNERKEPCDNVFEEFEFLSYLYARLADALDREAADKVDDWEVRANQFVHDHAHVWLPTFMSRTRELAEGEPYAAFAALGSATLEVIA